jgi:hypothetical protein
MISRFWSTSLEGTERKTKGQTGEADTAQSSFLSTQLASTGLELQGNRKQNMMLNAFLNVPCGDLGGVHEYALA